MEYMFFIKDAGNDTLDFCTFIAQALTFIITVITLIISIVTVCYAKREHKLHKQTEMANTLARYNERYCTDEHIERTVMFLMRYCDIKKNEKYKHYSCTEIFKMAKIFDTSSSNDKEIFLRKSEGIFLYH